MTRLADAALRIWITAVFAAAIAPSAAVGQDADPRPTKPDTTNRFPTTISGGFTPGSGFDIIKSDRGSLNISVYGLFRYVDQAPGGQTFTDHLGRVRQTNLQNSLNWQRTMRSWRRAGLMPRPVLRFQYLAPTRASRPHTPPSYEYPTVGCNIVSR